MAVKEVFWAQGFGTELKETWACRIPLHPRKASDIDLISTAGINEVVINPVLIQKTFLPAYEMLNELLKAR